MHICGHMTYASSKSFIQFSYKKKHKKIDLMQGHAGTYISSKASFSLKRVYLCR